MTEYKMLGEVVCYCSSCKLNLNHRITLMEGAEPARVLCLTCNREHRFKKTGGSPVERKAAVVRPSLTPSQVTKVRADSEENVWRRKLNNPDKSTVPYSINAEFQLDDLVMHPKFGVGLVVGYDFPDKLHLYFDEGVKILKGKLKKAEKPSTGAF